MPGSRSPVALLLMAALAVGCSDSSIPTDVRQPDNPLFGTIKGGGVDGASNTGSVPGSSFPPVDPSGESWSTVSGYGWRLGDPCESSGLCFNGHLVSSFGSLPHPDGSPPPVANDRFGVLSTADFICLFEHSGCENPKNENVEIRAKSSAVQTGAFTVPLIGDYQLEFRWAFLSSAADVGMDNFGRIQLVDLTDNTTLDLVNLSSGDIGDAGQPAARTGGCGAHAIAEEGGATLNVSNMEQYDLCTDWQSFKTSVAGRAGHSLRLRFEVTEVGDNVATTLAFEDVELGAAPTMAEGAVEQVEAPASAAYLWGIQAGCAIVSGTHNLQTVSFSCADNGTYQLSLVTTDDFGSAQDISNVTVTNVAPTVNPITVPAEIVPNTQFTATATFTDPGSGDTHAGVWDWGDGTETATLISSGTFENTHTYAQPGDYTIKLTVTDDDAGVGTAQVKRLVQPTVLPASIDIRPATSVNLINLRFFLIIPVALWGSASFDVTQVAVSTLRFGPGAAPPLLGALRVDLNRDGHKDLLASFSTSRAGIQVGQTSACLSGKIGGMPFQGCDAITVVSGQ